MKEIFFSLIFCIFPIINYSFSLSFRFYSFLFTLQKSFLLNLQKNDTSTTVVHIISLLLQFFLVFFSTTINTSKHSSVHSFSSLPSIHFFTVLGSSTGVASVKLSLIWNKICSHPDSNYITMKDFEDDGKYCKYFRTCICTCICMCL